jgi:hypothetical protein
MPEQRKKSVFFFLVVVVFPLTIVSMSISNLVKMDKNFIMCRISRDLAQAAAARPAGYGGVYTPLMIKNFEFSPAIIADFFCILRFSYEILL